MGGHYYAYSRPFDADCWYKFNDSVVTEASTSEVESTFGNSGNSYGGSSLYGYNSYNSYSYGGSTAYLLMYRYVGLVIVVWSCPHFCWILQESGPGE